jgi:alpha-methylacyl-CoA racemase
VFKTRSRDAWCELLEGHDACFAPVLSMSEAPRHEHNVARRTFVESDGVTQPAPAPRFDRTPSELPRAAPQVGRDSASVLRRAGYDKAAAQALVDAGVVHCAA